MEPEIMYAIAVELSIDPPWTAMPPIRVGRGTSEPAAFVTVERAGGPFARIDVHGPAVVPVWECLVWKKFVVIGRGDAVFVVDPGSGEVRVVPCAGSFVQLRPRRDRLEIASAEELICLDRRGREMWRRRS